MDEVTNAITSQPGARRWTRILGVVLIVVAVLAAFYLSVAYFAWQRGQVLRQESQQTETAVQVERQLSLAQENIAQRSYALAITRLDWILDHAPDNQTALALRQEAQAALDVRLTRVVVTVNAAPTPTVASEPGAMINVPTELERIQQLVDDETWPEAIQSLIAFQTRFPSVERQQTDRLLYESYIAYGLELVNSERVELGISYLRRAEKLGDLPQEALDYRTWAELYVQGVAFYGVNWGVATPYFRDLCLVAPFYQQSCDRLYEVLVAYGDQFAAAQDWCPAQELYLEAQQQKNSTALNDKLEQALEGCLAATPTPEAVITNTLTLPDENSVILTPEQP